jgi:hypothetical protein
MIAQNLRVSWTPDLQIHRRTDRCELNLIGVTAGYGATMQEAANDLLVRVHDLGLALHRGGLRVTGETGRPDPRVADFLWEIGEIAARGGDIRGRVLGAG